MIECVYGLHVTRCRAQVVAFFRGFLVSGDGSSLLTKACDDLMSAQIVTFDYAEFCQTIQVRRMFHLTSRLHDVDHLSFRCVSGFR